MLNKDQINYNISSLFYLGKISAELLLEPLGYVKVTWRFRSLWMAAQGVVGAVPTI
jgi:hypothetical protein